MPAQWLIYAIEKQRKRDAERHTYAAKDRHAAKDKERDTESCLDLPLVSDSLTCYHSDNFILDTEEDAPVAAAEVGLLCVGLQQGFCLQWLKL